MTLVKPEALPGSAVPSVSVWRDAQDEVFGWAARPFGAIETVHEWPPGEGGGGVGGGGGGGGGGDGSGGGGGGGGEHASVHRVSLAPGSMLDTAAHLGAEAHIL